MSSTSTFMRACLLTVLLFATASHASINIVSCVSGDGATQAPWATTIQTNSLACNTALYTEPLVDWDGLGAAPSQCHGNDVCGEQVFFNLMSDGSLDVQLGLSASMIIGSCVATTEGASITCAALEGTGTTTCTVIYDCDDAALC